MKQLFKKDIHIPKIVFPVRMVLYKATSIWVPTDKTLLFLNV